MRNIRFWARLLLGVAAIALLQPGLASDILGLAVAAVALVGSEKKSA